MTALTPRPPRSSDTCWVEHPAEPWHCTLRVGHAGAHWHTYSKTEWPQEIPEGGRPAKA